MDGGLFERAVLNAPKRSTAVKDIQSQAEQRFRDAYLYLRGVTALENPLQITEAYRR
jgi:hypothetical protein